MTPSRYAKILIVLLSIPISSVGAAGESEDIYLAPETFLAESFADGPPKPAVLWITKDLKPQIKDILGHDYPGLRIRYWRSGERTAWIIDEIGKVKPITIGIAIDEGKIDRLKVLVYRESHGWEVKYPFFTDQFTNAELAENSQLTQNIDGISGATLSVNALKRVSRLALFLHNEVTKTPSK